ncbi:helix-turn-helix domain-containing protein [Aquimarina gracilis]|uniref:Helix-turn-helix domain-containing protein n=1 Tax=Aquimarina gracilis TaxID=874422 RepID=A0ABU5ZZN5_9FLAO|nr:helix-turn-helix domain-containing protein [Aquimarina gracilis]MEB3347359.1 helix-turn-helix domain-containing protein [Aquimarina gracilis]
MSYAIAMPRIKKFFTYSFFAIFLFFNGTSLFGFQSSLDSLHSTDYSYLEKNFFQHVKDSVKAITYAKPYLLKSKKDQDTLKIVNGYYYFTAITKDEKITEKYVDSMILFSKNLKTKLYPAFAYFNKGKIEYNKGNFKKALDLYLKTNEKAEEFENIDLFYGSKKSIGILKSRIGEYKTALKELKECHSYYSNLKESKPNTYLSTLFALSDAYNLNKKLDSATIINRIGYKESISFNNEDFKCYFTLNEGINLFDKKNFTGAKDSLSRAINEFQSNEDKANLSMAYFYYGKTLAALNKENEAIAAHIKVDDIFQEISEIMPNNRENYEILINHYKKLGDKDNQLKYIERLISVDSVLHTNYRYLMKAVVQNYDTPRLLSDKQEIIDSLENEKKTSRTVISILGVISFLLLLLWLVNRHRQKQYKRRFEQLYNQKDLHKREEKQSVSSKERTKLAIPEESIKDILGKLDTFEKETGFMEPDLSIHLLAKRFGTNSKYLSKIVNTYKKKSFNYYINDLRIDRAIERLKTDSKFRNYTIKAIAREIGFNTTDAFSKAFFKRNGIHPSYFIKALEKQLEQ